MRSTLWYTRIGSFMRAHDNANPELSPRSHRDIARRAGPLPPGPSHHELDAVRARRQAREVERQRPPGQGPVPLRDFPPLEPYRGAPAGEPERLRRLAQPSRTDR